MLLKRHFAHLVMTSLLLAGCPPAVMVNPEPPPEIDTTLGVGDSFEVKVFGELDLTNTYRVSSTGTVALPLIGEVEVAGLDPRQVEMRIAEKLRDGKFMVRPQVSVMVKEQMSKRIVVQGQVARQGTLPYTPALTALEAVMNAGGFTQLASKNSASLTRVEKGQKIIIPLPLSDIAAGRAKNVYLRPGDILNVPERIF